MSEDGSILPFQKVYATPGHMKHMTKAALKMHDEIGLQHLADNTVNKKGHRSFGNAHDKALVGASTKLYEIVVQAAAKTIHL